MRLFVDANILVRCVAGVAARHASAAHARGLQLAVTERQVDEALQVLVGRIGLAADLAKRELLQVLLLMDLVPAADYAVEAAGARARMPSASGDDWHCLAAAMAQEAGIWTGDRDFFGVGVPVWSTGNIRFCAGETE
jgi:predicted nucleic acid-binding protein